MPSHRQLLTSPQPKAGGASTGLGTFSPGSADYASLRESFPGSPAYDGSYEDEKVVAKYEEVNLSPLNDGGHTFGLVKTDFSDSPDLTTVATGGGGLPGTPYGPNPSSPGPGLNPTNIPHRDAASIRVGGGGAGVGDGLANPANTRVNIARQKIGNLIFGKSTPR
jgi:hypothetical protein